MNEFSEEKKIALKKRIYAARLLGLGESQTKVAAEIGVTRQALNLWKSDPDFSKAFNAAKEAYDKFRNFYVESPVAAA